MSTYSSHNELFTPGYQHCGEKAIRAPYQRDLPSKCVGSVDICNLMSQSTNISKLTPNRQRYPDSKRVDPVQCCSGRLRHDLPLADCCKRGTQPQVALGGCWLCLVDMMASKDDDDNKSMMHRVWLVVLLGASISVVVNSACAGFLSGVTFCTHHFQILDRASYPKTLMSKSRCTPPS